VQGQGCVLSALDGDLPQILVPHVKLELCHFLFFNSGTPPVLEDDILAFLRRHCSLSIRNHHSNSKLKVVDL
jgi:hypothetical protein